MSVLETFAELVCSNVVVATGLAGLAWTASKLRAPSAAVHALWVLVLLKLVTPAWIGTRVEVPGWRHELPTASPRVISSGASPTWGDADSTNTSWRSEADIEVHGRRLSGRGRASDRSAPSTAIGRQVDAVEGQQVTSPTLLQRLLWLWICGSAALTLWTVIRLARFRRVLQAARPASVVLRERADELAKRVGLRWTPTVEVVPARISPMVFSLFSRPRILVPAALLRRLDRDALDTLLVHELAHVRRGDLWIRHLELLVRIVHWWNPLVWWAARNLRAAEEECCDAWVVWALPQGRRRYADALLGTVEYLNETRFTLPAAASGMGHVDDLKRRLTMIMQGKSRRLLSMPARLAMLAMAGVTLSWMPVFAQSRAPRPSEGSARADRPEAAKARLHELRQEMSVLKAQLEAARAAIEATALDAEATAHDAERALGLARAQDELRRFPESSSPTAPARTDSDRESAERFDTALRLLEQRGDPEDVDRFIVAARDAERAFGLARAQDELRRLPESSSPTDPSRTDADRELVESLEAASKLLEQHGDPAAVERLRRHLAEVRSHPARIGSVHDPRTLATRWFVKRRDRDASRADRTTARDESPLPMATDARQLRDRVREIEERHALELDRVEQKVDELSAMVRRLVELREREH